MKNLPTAEELLANNIDGLRDIIDDEDLFVFYKGVIECYAIEFAKLHVEQALKEASEDVELETYGNFGNSVNKDSILNSYPLKNIK